MKAEILPEKLTLILPVYNEAKRLEKAFLRLKQIHDCYPGWQIIFVDDGSTDKTKQVLEKKIKQQRRQMELISYSPNQGKGYAIKKGIEQASSKYALFSDIDFSTPLEELALFKPYMERDVDIVIGTRKVKGALITQHQPFLREWLGRQFTDLANFWLGTDISDYTCGFKLFKTEVAKKIFAKQRIKRWAFDAEILFLAQAENLKLVEVPVLWSNDKKTKVRLSRDILITLWELFQIRSNYLRGVY